MIKNKESIETFIGQFALQVANTGCRPEEQIALLL
jgi:hypothetical protein